MCEIILNDLNIEIKLPRLVGHQKDRSYPTNPQSPEVYNRINLYIPLLDCILQDMSSRFTKKENKNLFTLMQLIPSNLVKENNDTVLRTILQEILEITMKNPIFRDVTKEAINSELDI